MVLAREDAGAEKIFRSNGVQLLQRLLDTGEADLMLAALRTLVGICSEHQSRVGGAEGWGCYLSQSVCPSLRLWPSSLSVCHFSLFSSWLVLSKVAVRAISPWSRIPEKNSVGTDARFWLPV